ncbi:DUF6326 family protein [Angustibacter sp. Root456]|uniref:DUF6326 family protein n=1 Tax=Angustibacter sp. Root456 TaxID=1736539 RepID=UPI0007008D1A|nr:DUF6326 family protein [Angustibacter sp. Root456]KQX62847.1 hypothetical protein ASD06_12560 [Angustibacter sp. Root456]
MPAPTAYEDYRINARIKISALWTSVLFVFGYVDLFSSFRGDVRADIEAGRMFAFTIGPGFLLGATVYVLVPSLMVFLSLVLRPRVARTTNVVVAVLYAVTIVGGTIGEWGYYVLGSVAEAAALAAVVYYAWTWPKVAGPAGALTTHAGSTARAHAAPAVRGKP